MATTKFTLLLIISQIAGGHGVGITTTQIEFDNEMACKTTLIVMAEENFNRKDFLRYYTRIEKGYCINNDTGEVVLSEFGYNGK